MGRKLRADQRGIFPYYDDGRLRERKAVLEKALATRAGLPAPNSREHAYENLGNRDLPVWSKKAEIKRTIRDNQVSMVEGPTGSGKSTQVAQYALEMGYKKIIYLEPRIPLADNVADRFIVELGQQLGTPLGDELVGVRHSERSTGKGKTIEVMTPDTFLRVFREFENYDDAPILVVGDEIHERDFPTELAVAVAAQVLPERPKWRMCLMSATLDAEPIQRVYGEKFGRQIPLVSVEGRPFAVEMLEEPGLTILEAYEKYRGIHDKSQFFTAGKPEISDITEELEQRNYRRTRITPFHAKLSRQRIREATHASLRDGEKQVIPSTNAGASGITIAGLTLVISDGTVRRPDLDMDGVSGLFREHCSRDELVQQAGRAGRDVDGGMFVLVKSDDPENFPFQSLDQREEHAPAQIYHTNIARNVLAVTALGYSFYDLNQWLMNGVKERVVIEAYDVLYRLGAIDEQNKLTPIGEAMSRFPVRPELSRAIVAATEEGAETHHLKQLVAIVAAVEAGGLPYFERGVGDAWRNDVRSETEDDYTAQLDMFIATRRFYDGEGVDEGALEQRNYDIPQTKKAHRTYDKICRTLGVSGASDLVAPTATEVARLHELLTMGLFDFAHERTAHLDSAGRPSYVSIYDADAEKSRQLSDRGVFKLRDERLVLGVPRRFEKYHGGELEEHSVIEFVMPVTQQMIARAAIHLAGSVPGKPTLRQGHLKLTNKMMLGGLFLGENTKNMTVAHTPETKHLLFQEALKKKTQALSELVDIKKELERLMRLIPDEELDVYFPKGILTDDELQTLVNRMINGNVDNIFALDNNLRHHILINDINLNTWITREKLTEIRNRSPEAIVLSNGQRYQLYYTHGQPIINGFNLKDADALPLILSLDDGREVLIGHRLNGKDTRRHPASAIKDYAATV